MTNTINAKIFKLTSSQTDDIIIGITTGSLEDKLSVYKSMWMKNHRPNHMFYDLVRYYDCRIELIEEFSCMCSKKITKRAFDLSYEIFYGEEPEYKSDCFPYSVSQSTIKDSELSENDYFYPMFRNVHNQAAKWHREYSQIKEIRRTNINCECGKTFAPKHMNEHKSSQHHINFINSQ